MSSNEKLYQIADELRAVACLFHMSPMTREVNGYAHHWR